jgi:phosphate uptake regulator
VNIAKLVALSGHEAPKDKEILDSIERMGRLAHSQAMFMVLMARCLERIGDQTVDMAEQVVFAVTGLFEEMADASHPRPGGAAR